MTLTSTTESLPYTLLDVFTDVRLAGNALAVVHHADGLDEETMLAFSFETRLAETTFVQMPTVPGADYRNRIFSMAGEMPFAGHPTLGTAVAVARRQGADGRFKYVQQAMIGLTPIEVLIDGDRASASMLQQSPEFGGQHDAAPLLEAIGLDGKDAHPELPPQVVATGLPHLMLPIANLDALARAVPRSELVDAALERTGAYGLYVAVPDGSTHTARVRLFGRSNQVTEDPATGSAAGPLCAYLNARLGLEQLEITQGVEMGRRSVLRTKMQPDGVRVSGDVVVVVEGSVRLS